MLRRLAYFSIYEVLLNYDSAHDSGFKITNFAFACLYTMTKIYSNSNNNNNKKAIATNTFIYFHVSRWSNRKLLIGKGSQKFAKCARFLQEIKHGVLSNTYHIILFIVSCTIPVCCMLYFLEVNLNVK